MHQRVARLAVRLMPPSLAEELRGNDKALMEGVASPDRKGRAEDHRLQPDGQGTLDADVAAAVGEAVKAIRSRASFADIATHLGVLSHLVADASFPLNASSSDPRESAYYQDYTEYAASKLERFRPIFNGYADFAQGFDPAGYVRAESERANRRYAFISGGYFPDGSARMQQSSRFDDRGPIFGVTQLAFVDAVTATANVWLYVWRQARGDLSDTPFYATGKARRSVLAENPPRAAQRP